MNRMNTPAIVFLSLLLTLSLAEGAEHFSVTNGGVATVAGKATGGEFSVKGEGSPVANSVSVGGEFSMTTVSFQGLVLIQSPVGPLLTLAEAGGNAVISWTATPGTYQLQYTSSIAANGPGWAGYPFAPSSNGDLNSVAIDASDGIRFFRLQKVSR